MDGMDGKVSDFFNLFKPVVGSVTEQVSATQKKFEDQVESAKQTAVVYGGLTLFFQAVAAASAAFIAYTAWQQHKITRNGNRKRRH